MIRFLSAWCLACFVVAWPAAAERPGPVPPAVVEAFVLNMVDALKTPPDERQLERIRVAVAEELAERGLIAAEVRRRGLAATNEQIDAAERRAVDQLGGAERQAEFLRQNRFTREQYREYVLRPSLEGPALRQALAGEVAVSPEEARAWWAEHEGDAEFQRPARVTGAHLLVHAQPGVVASQIVFERKLEPGSEALQTAVREEIARRRIKAERLRAEALQPGADFAALVREHSDDPATRKAGGSLGTFARGAHPLALDDAFLALPPGEIGPLVETEFGFHVIKTLALTPAGRASWEEARPLVEKRLLAEKVGQRLQSWLREAKQQVR